MPPAQSYSSSLPEYLQTVLQQAGSQAVPYSQDAKWAVREQLIELQKVFPSLAIKVSDFHANDGRLLHLLKADGTIPIHYQGAKYNIPVVMWITSRFPNESPLVYVMPTNNMVIKGGHPYVDRSGQVNCPALRTWTFPKSNLVDLALEMSHLFGCDPPLYSQPGPPQSAAAAALAGSSSAAATGGGGGKVQSGPLPVTQPPPGYPSYAPAGGYQQPYSGSSSSSSVQAAIAGPAGPAGGGPASHPISTSFSSTYGYTSSPTPTGGSTAAAQPPPPPPPPPRPSALPEPVTSMAAANPLWGAAFSAYQRSGGGTPASQPSTPSFNSSAAAAALSQTQSGTSTLPNNNPFTQPPPPPPPPPAYSTPGMGLGNMPPPPPPGYASSASPPPPPPAAARPAYQVNDVKAAFRPVAIAALKAQVEAAEAAWATRAAADTDVLLDTQRVLAERRAQLQGVVSSLKAEREGTEGLVAEMGSKQAQLQAWLQRNEPKAAAWKQATAGGTAVGWDRVLPAADELSRQSLETQAVDLAIEDAVLVLDKALYAGLAGLTVDVYLKQVRALARKQYFSRALALKVADAQQKAPPPPPPARLSGPNSSSAAGGGATSRPYPLAHGDAWTRPSGGSAQGPYGAAGAAAAWSTGPSLVPQSAYDNSRPMLL